MSIFSSRWSKWYPTGVYCFNRTWYLVMVKKNHKTGVFKFKDFKINEHPDVGGNMQVESDTFINTLLDHEWE